MECSYGCLSNFDLPPPESPSGRNKLTVPAGGLYEAAPGQRLPAAMKGLVDRIEHVDARGRRDRAAMEARIGEQLERMGARIVDWVREDRAAILEALATPRDRPGA